MRRAVIDVGSNSVLLTVAELTTSAQGGGGVAWQPVLEATAVTALGEGVKVSGVLNERAMADTLAALRASFMAAHEAGAETVLAAATMAARIASNTSDFLARAEAQGTPVTVLSGEDEAELGLCAVLEDPMFAGHEQVSIIDVGGHSTELVTATRNPVTDGEGIHFRKSFPVGTLGLLSGPLSEECPDAGALFRAMTEIDRIVDVAYGTGEAGTVVALGATGTNLVTIREKMATWEPDLVHGAYLDYEEVSKAAAWLSSLTVSERSDIIGMEPGRERTLHAGALILERFLYAIRSEGCYVSVRGWRHALLTRIG